MSVEEIAKTNDMPTWLVAETMIRLMQKGLVAAPEDTHPHDHVEWLKATYPKPENTK